MKKRFFAAATITLRFALLVSLCLLSAYSAFADDALNADYVPHSVSTDCWNCYDSLSEDELEYDDGNPGEPELETFLLDWGILHGWLLDWAQGSIEAVKLLEQVKPEDIERLEKANGEAVPIEIHWGPLPADPLQQLYPDSSDQAVFVDDTGLIHSEPTSLEIMPAERYFLGDETEREIYDTIAQWEMFKLLEIDPLDRFPIFFDRDTDPERVWPLWRIEISIIEFIPNEYWDCYDGSTGEWLEEYCGERPDDLIESLYPDREVMLRWLRRYLIPQHGNYFGLDAEIDTQAEAQAEAEAEAPALAELDWGPWEPEPLPVLPVLPPPPPPPAPPAPAPSSHPDLWL